MSWTELAACIGQPTEIFFPEHGNGAAQAKRICADCPVIAECAEAGANEYYGVWAGQDLSARRGKTPTRAVLILPCRECGEPTETRSRGGASTPFCPGLPRHRESSRSTSPQAGIVTASQFHRAVPVSRGLDDDRPGSEWRCVGCGATTRHEGDLDDEPCPALHLFDGPDAA